MIERGRQRGYVTRHDLKRALPPGEAGADRIEDTMTVLSELGIALVEGEETDRGAGGRRPEQPQAGSGAAIVAGDPGRTDDPVTMYLRDMGGAALLTREGEVAVAKRTEAGRRIMLDGLCESPTVMRAVSAWGEAIRAGSLVLREAIDVEASHGGEAAAGNRRDAFERMRDTAAEAYRVHTGDVWRPRHGSHTSQTGTLTSAAIDARDFRRARSDRETQAHLPEGTLVAITGGKQVADADAVCTMLNRARAKYGDMILLHGGGPGIEKIAASWAEARGVDQVVCRPDWNAHGKAAPFRGNDELLNLLPKGVIVFPGSGITENLADKTTKTPTPLTGTRSSRFLRSTEEGHLAPTAPKGLEANPQPVIQIAAITPQPNALAASISTDAALC